MLELLKEVLSKYFNGSGRNVPNVCACVCCHTSYITYC
jgi:hypothetical protein